MSQPAPPIKISLTPGARPHKPYIEKYDRTKIAKVFQDEGCKLEEQEDWEYQLNHHAINYSFQNQFYTTNINRWVNNHRRPHIKYESVRRLVRIFEISEPISHDIPDTSTPIISEGR
jgi:hypothetical protein